MGNTRVDCPFDAEVWGVNNGYRQVMSYNRDRGIASQEIIRLEGLLPSVKDPSELFSYKCDIEEFQELLTAPVGRLDKVFICHRGQEYDAEGDVVFDFDELNSLSDQGVEIVSLFKVKELRKFVRLPYREITHKFQTEYFSDTIAYMIAYALHLNTRKVKGLLRLKEPMRIRMYGVDMHTADEYATERGGIEYFIGVAKTLGVDFWIHPSSSVCKTTTGKPYGFWKLDKKLYDPYNVMELQKSVKGIKRLKKLKLITGERFNKMVDGLEKDDTS